MSMFSKDNIIRLAAGAASSAASLAHRAGAAAKAGANNAIAAAKEAAAGASPAAEMVGESVTLDGRTYFHVLKVLAEGGFAAVYLVQRKVAGPGGAPPPPPPRPRGGSCWC